MRRSNTQMFDPDDPTTVYRYLTYKTDAEVGERPNNDMSNIKENQEESRRST